MTMATGAGMMSEKSAADTKAVSACTPLRHETVGGFQMHVVDDGVDYPKLARDAVLGNLASISLKKKGKHHRRVLLIEVDGRKYVIKVDRHPGNEWSQRLWQMLVGSVDYKLMKKVNNAVDNGCSIIPRIYMVAEKSTARLVTLSTMVIEYVEGRRIDVKSSEELKAVEETMRKLYSYGLAHTDISADNFIFTENGVKIIDLTFRGSFLFGKMKGLVRLKKRFGIEIPVEDTLERILYSTVALKESWNHFWRHTGEMVRSRIRR